jgi:hypothetical protein
MSLRQSKARLRGTQGRRGNNRNAVFGVKRLIQNISGAAKSQEDFIENIKYSNISRKYFKIIGNMYS